MDAGLTLHRDPLPESWLDAIDETRELRRLARELYQEFESDSIGEE